MDFSGAVSICHSRASLSIPALQLSLAMFGGLIGVSSRLEIYFLEKVAPAFVSI